ncbi:MAG: cysteine hydrolase [Clostridiales bacterium]|nr:cysteine hydrolase [Clostridiales bacterium]
MQNWEMDGKPALVLLHMQNGIIGGGKWIKEWYDGLRETVTEMGMFDRIQELLAAFRERELPVVFVNVIPNAFGPMPKYGILMNQNVGMYDGTVMFENEDLKEGLAVMDEMDRRLDEPVLYNWLLGGFTNSGLDLVLKTMGVQTVVLVGFAQNSVVYHTAAQAGDLWYSTIVPSDGSACYMPRVSPKYREGIDELVSEVVLDQMFPFISLVTTTADVIAHLPDKK